MGSKKKGDDDEGPTTPPSEPGEERPEGASAEAFYQPVDNMGFSPRHPQPPPYIKVRSRYKKEREFNKVFFAQKLAGTESAPSRRESIANGKTMRRSSVPVGDAVWAMEVSKDGRYLAASGQDHVVRVWKLLSDPHERRDFERTEEANMGAPGHVHLSAPVFKQEPVQTYIGHDGPVLGLSWSKNNFLLSSSMDKTVRLWHVSRDQCLCAFKHNDFVTSVSFHPKDDRFFLAGSLDSKLRLWSIPDKTVAFWSQTPDMITAVTFSPDGKTAIAGCVNGLCQLHETDGLRYTSQIHVRSRTGKNTKGSKITGIQAFNAGHDKASRDLKLLVTSNDSRVRLYNVRDKSLEMKFKGNENASSQIRARLTDDGQHVVCGSEDGKVYIWSTTPSDAEKKDKWPVEIFEAHTSPVTCAFFLPTRSRQLLGQSEDPLYDLCNPPPVTLVSRNESSGKTSPPSEPDTPTSPQVKSPSQTTTTQTSTHSALASASPQYLARSTHPDGNIIVTADDTGVMKVFRQDCAWLQRMRSDLGSETSSLKRAGSALVRRSNSMATTRSNASGGGHKSGLVRQDSTTSVHTTTSGARERILNWRQSVGGSSTHSLDKSTPAASASAASSPALAQHRHGSGSPRISLSLMKPHFGRHSAMQHSQTQTHPASPSSTPASPIVDVVAPSPTGSDRGGSVSASTPHAGNTGAPLAPIPSVSPRPDSMANKPRPTDAPQRPSLSPVPGPRANLDPSSAASADGNGAPVERVPSSAYWSRDAWRDELKAQLSAPHRDLSANSASGHSASVSPTPSHGGSGLSRASSAASARAAAGKGLGTGVTGGNGGLRPTLSTQLTGWSAMTLNTDGAAEGSRRPSAVSANAFSVGDGDAAS